jgi:hypothetical protein
MRSCRWSLALLVCCLTACGSAAAPTREVRNNAQPSAGAAPPAAGSGSDLAKPAGDNSVGLITGAGGAAGASGPGRSTGDGCSDAAKLIYVVDADGRFSSFDPRSNPPRFVDITRALNCPAKPELFGIPATPYSMSVDRSAIAWVLYSSGELFRVDTATGSCQATMFRPNQSGFLLMGMGFVSNTKMGSTDTLYVAGGTGPDNGGASRLGTIDMSSLTVMPAQQLTGWPELTGTGNAELWGFYPDTSPPKVAKLDKQTGAEDVVYPLASLQGTPNAWAFAFWGGDFWVFLMRESDNDTTVYRVNGATGAMTVALMNTGRKIVGAGVSTCAPLDLQ